MSTNRSEVRVCTQCGFTYGEFQTRGLLGCPQCYVCFGELLWADLLHRHPGLYKHAMPSAVGMEPEPGTKTSTGDLEDLAQLKEMLNDALRDERYEEAATLHRKIQTWGKRHVSR